ncbi:hypothetical protein EHF33_20775 (plasmid) [Deinococcus psychrotolerans]|uniref:Uncharacterized protein n=1 Tax=Deinococcus psychrotolerans TaxID=2489213 RepID=A0A3G8YMC3_9DEIO|nr:hypothetical protein [Deinococcus psychrotolerans]AZI45347.1 hypothetical protein EHF33_20775 [Deinococcus psychrotolerans]
MTQTAYFRAVILTSIKKRWSWLLGLPVLLFIMLMIAEQQLWFSAALTVVSLFLLTGYAAWASYQRHKYSY